MNSSNNNKADFQYRSTIGGGDGTITPSGRITSINMTPLNSGRHFQPPIDQSSSHYYSGVFQQQQQVLDMSRDPRNNQYGYAPSNYDKAYSMALTEPIVVNTQAPLIIVDPPCEPYTPSYLSWSIFNLICCCVFGGIITTAMSLRLITLNDNYEYKQAYKLSGKVLLANMIVSAVGAILIILVFPYIWVIVYPYLPKINY